MHPGYHALTDKEKDALRLLLRGHDAKSCARALGLSVHTVNERLRDARRKLGVTSSREAARIVLAAEAATPELFGNTRLGDAPGEEHAAHRGASPTGQQARARHVLPLIGVIAMSALLAALLLNGLTGPATPGSVTPEPVTLGAETASPEMNARPADDAAAQAAQAFLALVDEGRWAESYAATGAQFRALNTQDRWAEVSQRVRPPLGAMVTRDLVSNAFVPAPPQGYRMVTFRSTYSGGAAQTESLSLAWEDGAWKVAGIAFD